LFVAASKWSAGWRKEEHFVNILFNGFILEFYKLYTSIYQKQMSPEEITIKKLLNRILLETTKNT